MNIPPTEGRNHHQDLGRSINTLIERLNADGFFKIVIGNIETTEEPLASRLFKNLKIIINDELVSQLLISRLPTDDLNNHKALLYLLINFTSEELQLFLNQKLLRRIILLILEKNEYQLIRRLPEINKNLDILIVYNIFEQTELDLLIQPNSINQTIFDIITNSYSENLEFFAKAIPDRLKELIHNWNFQDLLKRASPRNLKLLEKLIIDLLTKIVSNHKDQKPDEAVFTVTMLLAIKSHHLNLKIFKELGSLTEEKLKACAKRNNFIYFISHTNPFNLELLQKYGLLTEEIWEFLEENSRDLMIYSDPGVLELLLKKGIINFENLPVLFKDEVIEPAILQEGKPENFEALIQAGLINPDNFGQLVTKPGFDYLVQMPPKNLQEFLKKISDLGESDILNILNPQKTQFSYNPNNPEITIIEFLKPETYANILSRLPPPKSNQN